LVLGVLVCKSKNFPEFFKKKSENTTNIILKKTEVDLSSTSFLKYPNYILSNIIFKKIGSFYI